MKKIPEKLADDAKRAQAEKFHQGVIAGITKARAGKPADSFKLKEYTGDHAYILGYYEGYNGFVSAKEMVEKETKRTVKKATKKPVRKRRSKGFFCDCNNCPHLVRTDCIAYPTTYCFCTR